MSKFSIDETRKAAAQTIANMEFLLKREEFTSFMDRMRREADSLADQVLHNDTLTLVEREAMRNKRLGLLEVLKSPSDDITACQNVIRGCDNAKV